MHIPSWRWVKALALSSGPQSGMSTRSPAGHLVGADYSSMLVRAMDEILGTRNVERQSDLLVRTQNPILEPAWTVTPVSPEDLVLAYMSQTLGLTAALERSP